MSETFELTAAQHDAFWRDGFLIVEGFLTAEETQLARETARANAEMAAAARDVRDAEGRNTNLTLWNDAGEDLFGVIARAERVVGTMEALLDDEVYHYHSKLSAKQPRVGGAWEWHQDYGYWYQNGCLFPDMASVYIALDPCSKENGCLQVLRGSHALGRIDHTTVGDQVGADPERVARICERLETVHAEMPAGAALFFHCNTLHCSDANDSDAPRWGLICCYNTKHNDPVIESHHPRYSPIARLPDSAILEFDARRSGPTDYLAVEADRTVPEHAKHRENPA